MRPDLDEEMEEEEEEEEESCFRKGAATTFVLPDGRMQRNKFSWR
jgi:hypothetical protein